MSEADKLGLGKIMTDTWDLPGRDAIHVAIIPVQAGEILHPGQRVGVQIHKYSHVHVARTNEEYVGLVDPLLGQDVQKGECFWLWIFPGKVTGIRHDWAHPNFSMVDYKPLPPVSRDGPSWRTCVVVDICKRLLEQNYDYYDAIYLADALADSGYPDEEVIRQCRKGYVPKALGRRLVCLVYSDETAKAVEFLDFLAGRMEITYLELLTVANTYLETGDYITQHGSESWRDEFREEAGEFWKAYEVVNSCKVKDHEANPFSCSC